MRVASVVSRFCTSLEAASARGSCSSRSMPSMTTPTCESCFTRFLEDCSALTLGLGCCSVGNVVGGCKTVDCAGGGAAGVETEDEGKEEETSK